MQTSDGSTAKRNTDIAKMFRRHGPDLGFEAVLLWVKGDHSDSNKTHALPAVTGRHSPCQFCNCTSWTMCCFTEHWSVLNCPFDITDDEAYFQFCDSRETKVEIRTEAERMLHQSSFYFSKLNTIVRRCRNHLTLPVLDTCTIKHHITEVFG